VLVNNAGIGTAGGRRESADGYELAFAGNYLSHFLLTRQLLAPIERCAPAGGCRQPAARYELASALNSLSHFLLTRQLLPPIERSAPARIVNVSSAGQAPIDFEDVMLERSFSGVQAYCQSKLALVM